MVIEPCIAPSASGAVGVETEQGWRFVAGAAGSISTHTAAPATTDTLYDLASLTKSVTAVLASRVARTLPRALDTRLQDLLPEAASTPSGHATLAHLLSHRAGLRPHIPLFREVAEPQSPTLQDVLKVVSTARRPECTGPVVGAGFAPVYSDLGYMLVGLALERHCHLPFDELVDREIDQPSGLQLRSARGWARQLDGQSALVRRVAPTEEVAWRGGEIRGVVHDDNAFVLSGTGCSGHAGLFSTASDVARFGASLLDALREDTSLLSRAEIRELLRDRPGGELRAGFDGKSETGSSAGERFGEDAFGHLGFTGTSYWCDRASRTVVVLLTNRVSPSRDHIAIRAARPKIHTAMFDLAQTLRR